jgi:hypothetical protein
MVEGRSVLFQQIEERARADDARAGVLPERQQLPVAGDEVVGPPRATVTRIRSSSGWVAMRSTMAGSEIRVESTEIAATVSRMYWRGMRR